MEKISNQLKVKKIDIRTPSSSNPSNKSSFQKNSILNFETRKSSANYPDYLHRNPLSHINSILNILHDEETEDEEIMSPRVRLEYHSTITSNLSNLETEEVKIENYEEEKRKKNLNRSDDEAIQIIDNMFADFISNSKSRENPSEDNNFSVNYDEESIGKWLERLKSKNYDSIKSEYGLNYQSCDTYESDFSTGVNNYVSRLSNFDSNYGSKLSFKRNIGDFSTIHDYSSKQNSSFLREKMVAYSSRKEGNPYLMKTLHRMVRVLKTALNSVPTSKEFEVFEAIQGMFEEEGFSLNSLRAKQEDPVSSTRDRKIDSIRNKFSEGSTDFSQNALRSKELSLGTKRSAFEFFGSKERKSSNGNGLKDSLLSDNNVLVTASEDIEIFDTIDENEKNFENFQYFSFKKSNRVSTVNQAGKLNTQIHQGKKINSRSIEEYAQEKLEQLIQPKKKKYKSYLKMSYKEEKKKSKKYQFNPVVTNTLDSIIEASYEDSTLMLKEQNSTLSHNTSKLKNLSTGKKILDIKPEENSKKKKQEVSKSVHHKKSSCKENPEKFHETFPKFEKVKKNSNFGITLYKSSMEQLLEESEQGSIGSDPEEDELEDNPTSGYETVKVVHNSSYQSFSQLSEPRSIKSTRSTNSNFFEENAFQPVPCHLPEEIISRRNSEQKESEAIQFFENELEKAPALVFDNSKKKDENIHWGKKMSNVYSRNYEFENYSQEVESARRTKHKRSYQSGDCSDEADKENLAINLM